MAERLRVMCPICGMKPTLENLEQAAKEKPAEIRIFLQRYGGKIKTLKDEDEPYKKKGRGSAPGFIEWEDVTDKLPDEVEKMKEFFDNRIKRYKKVHTE